MQRSQKNTERNAANENIYKTAYIYTANFEYFQQEKSFGY